MRSLWSSGRTKWRNGELFFLPYCHPAWAVMITLRVYHSARPNNLPLTEVFVHQSVWQHPGRGGERCGEREEPAAAAPAAAQLHPGRVLPAVHQRRAGGKQQLLRTPERPLLENSVWRCWMSRPQHCHDKLIKPGYFTLSWRDKASKSLWWKTPPGAPQHHVLRAVSWQVWLYYHNPGYH